MLSTKRLINKYVSIALIFLAGVINSARGQQRDAGAWASITLEKKMTQGMSCYFNESFRFIENFSELGTFFSEIGVERKLHKNLQLSLAYRYANKRGMEDSYSSRHRYFADFAFRKKMASIAVIYRTRIQTQVENYFLPAEKVYGNTPENYWRNKLSVRFLDFKKIKPAVSAELWYPVANPEKKYFDNVRFTAGIQYDLDKKNSFEAGYIIQKEIRLKNPQTDFITTLSYNFAF